MSFATPAITALVGRQGITRFWTLWIEAKNRDTGALQTLGLWDSSEDVYLSPEGASRLYLGAAGIFNVKPLVYAVGTSIRSQTVVLSANNQNVETILRGFDVRFAPVQLHLAIYDGSGTTLLGIDRRFNGTIDGAPIIYGANGESATATIKMVSSARNGTLTPAARKSDQQQRLRQDDRFRRYAGVSAVAADWWGSEKGGDKK